MYPIQDEFDTASSFLYSLLAILLPLAVRLHCYEVGKLCLKVDRTAFPLILR